LVRASSALAYLQGRDYVIPEDIVAMAPDVLRHRLILNHAARAAGFDADAIIQKIIDVIAVP
jgi:MoxR-like ATPase